jgi:hypothetical protein
MPNTRLEEFKSTLEKISAAAGNIPHPRLRHTIDVLLTAMQDVPVSCKVSGHP